MNSRFWPLAATALAGLALGPQVCQAQAPGPVPRQSSSWVGTWASAQQLTEPGNLPPLPGLSDTTLRQIVHVSVGGARLRVRFSNAFGKSPLTILSAHVALPAPDGAIQPGTDRALTFHGALSVTIPPGAPEVSDDLPFRLSPLSDLAVTIYVQDAASSITGHPGARCKTYLRAGNTVSDLTLTGAAATEHWYYLCGVDVAADASDAVVVLGDSLTDGRGSTTNGNTRWPDNLARRLQAAKTTAHIGVLNAGIGGNRVCNDGLGPSALARLDRDVLTQPGVRWLIIWEGINDLGTKSASAADLIAAYDQMIVRAHACGICVYGGTITPCAGSNYFSPELEIARQAVNAWVRNSGRFDGVIDFDAAIRDPQQPSRLKADADSGDHLHLNNLGYRALADIVDLDLFQMPDLHNKTQANASNRHTR